MEMISALKLNSFIRSNRAFCMESLWFFHITSCDLWINITLFLPSDVNDFYFFFLPNFSAAAAAAKSLQLDPTLCDLIDGSPPGSPVPEILKARTLEWVAISFSNALRKWTLLVVSDSSQPHGLQPTRLVCPWDFPGKCSEVGCHCLLWKIVLAFV